jgi:hypothetical protein
MSKSDLLTHSANFAPGFLQRGRRTWIGFGLGLLVFIALLIWAALALIGWLWGQTQSLAGTAPEALRGTASQVIEQAKAYVPGAQGLLDQVKASVPGAREMLAGIVPSLKPESALQRDVSGDDLGPVARHPGFVRSQWQRTGSQAAVGYEGKADYAKVLDYYSQGFVAEGFVRSVQSATPVAETHDYAKGAERFVLNVAKKPGGIVSVRIESAQR